VLVIWREILVTNCFAHHKSRILTTRRQTGILMQIDKKLSWHILFKTDCDCRVCRGDSSWDWSCRCWSVYLTIETTPLVNSVWLWTLEFHYNKTFLIWKRLKTHKMHCIIIKKISILKIDTVRLNFKGNATNMATNMSIIWSPVSPVLSGVYCLGQKKRIVMECFEI